MPLPDGSVDAKVFEQLGWDIASAWNMVFRLRLLPCLYLLQIYRGGLLCNRARPLHNSVYKRNARCDDGYLV
jgi:hypothetical protein